MRGCCVAQIKLFRLGIIAVDELVVVFASAENPQHIHAPGQLMTNPGYCLPVTE